MVACTAILLIIAWALATVLDEIAKQHPRNSHRHFGGV